MKPLAYGYMRVFCDVTDAKLRAMEERIRHHAEQRGYQFARTFHEHENGSRDMFNELAAELVTTDAHLVIVPSLRHLSYNQVFQQLLIMQLEQDASAEVYDLKELDDGADESAAIYVYDDRYIPAGGG